MLGQVGSAAATPARTTAWMRLPVVRRRQRQPAFRGAKLALFVVAPGEDAVRAIDGARMGVGYVDTPAGYSWHNETPGSRRQPAVPHHRRPDRPDRRRARHRLRQAAHARAAAGAARRARRRRGGRLLRDSAAWQGRQPRRDDLTFSVSGCFAHPLSTRDRVTG
jgi:hypothetical protein